MKVERLDDEDVRSGTQDAAFLHSAVGSFCIRSLVSTSLGYFL